MGARTVRTRAAVRGGFVTVLVAAVAVFASGCGRPGAVVVDPVGLPGTYRDGETGGEIRLHVNGRFSVAGISESDLWWHGGPASVDFGGTWSATSHSNFVYLVPDETSDDQALGDIQLYTASPKKVFLHPDVDGPVTLELVKVTNP
ncbi:hypothetical protein ABZ016_26875 [Streptomyces sp. NPDC006372]|uniref:hypothetical protein n=1 Tax=Streptomyces sp. NPDC006372 TaxID=3155599 RepID=UPI0033BD5262